MRKYILIIFLFLTSCSHSLINKEMLMVVEAEEETEPVAKKNEWSCGPFQYVNRFSGGKMGPGLRVAYSPNIALHFFLPGRNIHSLYLFFFGISLHF